MCIRDRSISSYSISGENFEAYPNRDSTPYVSEYLFDEKWKVKEFVRGTLRLDGWKEAWQDIFSMLEKRSDNIEAEINEKSEELLKNNKYLPEEEDRVVLSVKLKAFENNNKIDHVGIALENHQIIHASGKVRVDNLSKKGILLASNKQLTHRLHSIKRIIE